jgi:hypothetical protein
VEEPAEDTGNHLQYSCVVKRVALA